MDAAWKYEQIKSEKQFKKGDPRIFCAYQPRNEPPTYSLSLLSGVSTVELGHPCTVHQNPSQGSEGVNCLSLSPGQASSVRFLADYWQSAVLFWKYLNCSHDSVVSSRSLLIKSLQASWQLWKRFILGPALPKKLKICSGDFCLWKMTIAQK